MVTAYDKLVKKHDECKGKMQLRLWKKFLKKGQPLFCPICGER